jgi:hypothetical protein
MKRGNIMRKWLIFLLLFCLASDNALGQSTEAFPPASVPSLVSAVRIEGPVSFCGEQVPLDSVQVRERLEKEMLLILWNRPQVILWLKRSTRYFPFIEKTLAQHWLKAPCFPTQVLPKGL